MVFVHKLKCASMLLFFFKTDLYHSSYKLATIIFNIYHKNIIMYAKLPIVALCLLIYNKLNSKTKKGVRIYRNGAEIQLVYSVQILVIVQ